MHRLIISLFFTLFFVEFLVSSAGLNRVFNLVPEILSIFAILIVIGSLAYYKKFFLPKKYLLFMFLFFLLVVTGIVINSVPSGAVVIGIRSYLKFAPFFLIPLVYQFSDRQIRSQLLLLVGFSLIQFPISIYQRFVQYRGVLSGDSIVGTLGLSGTLTIFLSCAITISLAFFLSNRITGKHFLLMFFLLFLPMTINETKVTLLLLPMALFFPLFFQNNKTMSLKKYISLALVTLVLFTGFFAVYDFLMSERYDRNLVDVIVDPEYLARYLAPQAYGEETDKLGKVDKITKPLIVLSKDPVTLMVGLGMGNVIKSPVKYFVGNYQEYQDSGFVGGGIGTLLWEFGILGLLLVIFNLWMVLRDSISLSKEDGLFACLGLGWIGVVSIFFISLFYSNPLISNSLSYLFWYYSGIVVSACYQKRISRVESRKGLYFSASQTLSKQVTTGV